MNLVVGSEKPHKLQAVGEACKKMGVSAQIFGVNTCSMINEQPIGIEEAHKGALTRARLARHHRPDSVGVGIENCLTRFSSINIDIAVIVLLHPNGRQIITTSPGIQIPAKYVVRASDLGFDTTTAGMVVAAELGGDPADPHSTLTDGKVSRQMLLVDGLVIALTQLLHINNSEGGK